jgi:hypothetical protein
MRKITCFTITFLFLQICSDAQSLNLSEIKNLWLSSERDLDFAKHNFTKNGDIYQRDRVTICSNGDSSLTNYNETFFFYSFAPDDLNYMTWSQEIFVTISKEIRTFSKVGIMERGDYSKTQGSVYYDGKFYYALFVIDETCWIDKASPLNSFEIRFYKQKPGLLKTE